MAHEMMVCFVEISISQHAMPPYAMISVMAERSRFTSSFGYVQWQWIWLSSKGHCYTSIHSL